jgi:hypothetical protein
MTRCFSGLLQGHDLAMTAIERETTNSSDVNVQLFKIKFEAPWFIKYLGSLIFFFLSSPYV